MSRKRVSESKPNKDKASQNLKYLRTLIKMVSDGRINGLVVSNDPGACNQHPNYVTLYVG